MGRGITADIKMRQAGFRMQNYHCHTQFELFYVLSGSCRFLLDDNIFDLSPGDFLLIPPGVLHYTRYLGGDTLRFSAFFTLSDILEDTLLLLPQGERFFSEARIFHVPDAHLGAVEALLRRMVREIRIADERSSALLSLYLQELFISASRYCDLREEDPTDIRTSDLSVIRAAKYIGTHYREPITTADVARAAGYSQNYLLKKFREAAGLGVHGYLSYVRLRHAAQELIETDDSITEIALRCGFSDSNYFKDAFKAFYGVTPREYRKNTVGNSVLFK